MINLKTLILAEKPSVGRNIADALKCTKKENGYLEGSQYIVTWAFGHLLNLYDTRDYDEKLALWNYENFPYIPKEFKYKIKEDSKVRGKTDQGAKRQLEIISNLIKRDDVDRIISATDYDREGETISLLIFNYLNVEKPIFRILLNEWTPVEIERGLKELRKNEDMKNLQFAGISRQITDWVIGINFTSMATLKYCRGRGNLLNVGRVLMPTLKMIYDREKQIREFKSENYFELYATFQNEAGDYKGKFFYDKLDKFPKKESVERLKDELTGKSGVVTEKKVELKKEYPPALFNLSNLQGYITSKYNGWTSEKVLKTAQLLYEKKFITYPRTSSTALEESLTDKAEQVLNAVKKSLPFADEIKFSVTKKVFNNEKVESHSAIIPTYILPGSISNDEKAVYEAVRNRFIAQFMEAAEFENTEIITTVMGEKYPRHFITKGKILKKKSWLKLEGTSKKDELLPMVKNNDEVDILAIDIQNKKTKPPAHHTEKTLLKAMETCGKNSGNGENEEEEQEKLVLSGYSIGTAATRAEIINKLKTAGYIEPKGKSLLITERGINFIDIFPVKELLDTDYTGRMEKALADMEKGTMDKNKFLQYIFNFTINGVKKIKFSKAAIICDTRENKK
ncbi:DNA topoisomerase-3 [Hathewaya proteolytica DSM 3090]|uniref:DNA topoisomerase n=1 Tax=Hathewaya proteolytica DSM 3090 TaxID=1121331 RepID=A0A1M6RU27_9CLOT|nr:DNA topoisomerase-3 [Hathewaya proteolytica DSM 3090]